MQTFRFRLDNVLKWYREQCETEENRLAHYVAALHATAESIARLEAERRAVDHEVITRSSIAARELVALGLYRLRATQRAAQLTEERGTRQTAVDQQQIQVQAARRHVRLVEKLRERRRSEHVYAEERESENLAAESFLATWAGRGRKGIAGGIDPPHSQPQEAGQNQLQPE